MNPKTEIFDEPIRYRVAPLCEGISLAVFVEPGGDETLVEQIAPEKIALLTRLLVKQAVTDRQVDEPEEKDPCLYPLPDGRRCLECGTCRGHP